MLLRLAVVVLLGIAVLWVARVYLRARARPVDTDGFRRFPPTWSGATPPG